MDIFIPEKFAGLADQYRYYIYHGGRGSGKCLSPDTKIIMYDGSIKKASEIAVNDLLMGPDSTPRKVIDTHNGTDEMYRVVQNQAIDYIVNSQHLLVLRKNPTLKNDCGEIMSSGNLRRPNGRYPDYEDITIMPVLEFDKKSARFKDNFHGYKTGLINFPHKDVLIEPYFLGVWLGDGEAACQRITTMDQEILEYCTEYANKLDLDVSIYDKRQKSFTIGMVKRTGKTNNLLGLLKHYDLINNKHIPKQYLINSEKNRLELLAGILDTDSCVQRACAYLTMKSLKFVEQVKFLADSLGFRTSKDIKKREIKLNDKTFYAYSLTISGNLERIPFKIKRRIDGAKSKPNKDYLKTKIKIESLGIGPYVGFELDRDHLFLLQDGTVVHNSHSIARYLVCSALDKPTKILCTREMQNSITESVYVLLKDIITQYELADYFHVKNSCIDCVNGSTFIFKGLAHNINSVKSTEGVDICWVEEADKVSQNSWDILVPTIRKPDSKFIITFNPTNEDDPVYQMFIVKNQPNSIVEKVNYNDNPFFPDVLKQELEHMKATDYDRYLHVWEGELRTISDAQVFKNKFVVEQFDTFDEVFYYGMDFGFAKDPTTITRAFIRGRSLYIDREQYGHHIEIDKIPMMIKKIMEGSESWRWKIKADCARPETISYLKNLHFNVEGASKWSGSIEDGIEYIKSFDKIIIHPSCIRTIEEFTRYSYKIDRRTNEILPIVLDDYNHIIDAIRYSLSDLIKRKTTIYDSGVL